MIGLLPFPTVSGLLDKAAKLMTVSLRFNRKYKRFTYRYMMAQKGIDVRLAKPAGRRIIMRRLLKESKFLGWGHDPFDKTVAKPLNYPL